MHAGGAKKLWGAVFSCSCPIHFQIVLGGGLGEPFGEFGAENSNFKN